MGKGFLYMTELDLMQNLRSKWFWAYSLLFGAFVAIMFLSGVTESQIIGFVGLSRLMVTFMQVSMAILPIYVLITTVRSVVGDRESNVMEYMLSLPISFSAYYWSKFVSKFLVIYIPVLFALIVAIVWGGLKNLEIPWNLFFFYSALLAALIFNFLGLGMYISARAKSQEIAIGTAFIIWLILVAFLDLLLMGMMLKLRMNPDMVIWGGMINPLQIFRTGSLVLFDRKLTVMGPASYYVLDVMGRNAFLVLSIAYPLFLGWLFAFLGGRYFRRHDVI